MEALTKQTCILIIIFWVIAPTFDLYSDILLITKLFRGPAPDQFVFGGNESDLPQDTYYLFATVLPFPSALRYNGSFHTQPMRIKHAYRTVT